MHGRETSLIRLVYGPIGVEKVKLFYVDAAEKQCQRLHSLLKWNVNTQIAPLATPLGSMDSMPMKRFSAVFYSTVENMRASCSFNIQYSFAKYFKLDTSIMELQKELLKIEEQIDSMNAESEREVWEKIRDDLKKKGVAIDDSYLSNVSKDEEKLAEFFEEFMELSRKYEDLFKANESRIEELNRKKEPIKKKLDEFIVEADVTEPVILDELGISTRKRGIFVHMDLHDNNGKDMARDEIPAGTESRIIDKFREIDDALNKLTQY